MTEAPRESCIGLRGFGRFCLVGVTGLVLDTLLLQWFLGAWGWSLVGAKLLASEVALLNNFFWNDRWTFRRRWNGAPWGIRLLWFHGACVCGILLAAGCLQLSVRFLPLWLANGVAVAAASSLTFGMSFLLQGSRFRPTCPSQGNGSVD